MSGSTNARRLAMLSETLRQYEIGDGGDGPEVLKLHFVDGDRDAERILELHREFHKHQGIHDARCEQVGIRRLHLHIEALPKQVHHNRIQLLYFHHDSSVSVLGPTRIYGRDDRLWRISVGERGYYR